MESNCAYFARWEFMDRQTIHYASCLKLLVA